MRSRQHEREGPYIPKPKIIGQGTRLADIEDLKYFGQGNGLANLKTDFTLH